MVTEIDRLMLMKAVQRTALRELEKEESTGTESGEREREREKAGFKWLTTKFVFDWRFRERKWIRRAQFVTGKRCQVNLYLDSSAARGIITRQGVGRVKHLQMRTLFLQELRKQGTLSVHQFRNVCRNSAEAKPRNSHVAGRHVR